VRCDRRTSVAKLVASQIARTMLQGHRPAARFKQGDGLWRFVHLPTPAASQYNLWEGASSECIGTLIRHPAIPGFAQTTVDIPRGP
jgi:hypothetical protein